MPSDRADAYRVDHMHFLLSALPRTMALAMRDARMAARATGRSIDIIRIRRSGAREIARVVHPDGSWTRPRTASTERRRKG